MSLSFIWWWGRAEEIYPYWRDGLRAALEEIGKTNEVYMYLGEKAPDKDYDNILFWGDSNCPFFAHLDKYKGKKGIILTTDPRNFDNLKKLDVIFCESTPVYDAVRAHGLHAVRAFGTDTDFFTPDPKVKKDIPYFYPATFSPWKKQSEIAYLGKNLYCVGTLQPDGTEEIEACRKTGVNMAEGYFKVEDIRHLYRRAERVIIPAIHGSERTVLEAMSCDILPEIINYETNIRAYSYIKEFDSSKITSPREFVVKNYSHNKYAADILKGFS